MRRLFNIAVFAVCGLALAGCYTEYHISSDYLNGKRYVENGKDVGEIVEHFQNQNYGWYLFDYIPLISGHNDRGHNGMLTLFSDQVRTDLLTEKLNQYARKTDTLPVAVSTLNTDLVMFEVPGLSIPVILPYIICYREVQISALLLKKESEDGE